jgi:hypothetical protein
VASLVTASGFDPVTWIKDNLAGSSRVGTQGPIPKRATDAGWRRASASRKDRTASPARREEHELVLTGGDR